MFSLQWALTHRFFPRILPDSSNSPRVILIFLFKRDVRMDPISHMLLQDCFQILFIFGSTFPLLILPEYLNNSWWCFSSSFSDFEDRKRVPLKSLPVLPKIRGSSSMPSSHNCFRLWEFFSPIRSISGVVFSVSIIRRPSFQKNSSSSHFSYRYPIIPVLCSNAR